MLVFTEDHSTEEDKYQVFVSRWYTRRRKYANTAVKTNEDQLAEFLLYKHDERAHAVTIVFVW